MDFSQNDSIWGDSLFGNTTNELDAPVDQNAPINAALLERSEQGSTP